MPEASRALSDRGCAAPPIYPSRVCLAVARQPVRVSAEDKDCGIAVEGLGTDEVLLETVAGALWFDHVDQHGYPNGLPAWDELVERPELDRGQLAETFRSYARAAIPIVRARCEAEGEALRQCAETPFSGWTIAQGIARQALASSEHR